jgi:thiol-disulfide isomerase/thioredoxin
MRYIGIFLFIIVLRINSQDVLPLSSIKDLDALKESGKGKVVLVNFWATWCKPCVSEFSSLVKLYNDYKDKNFKLIFISVDVPEDIDSKVKPFLQSKGLDFTTYYNKFDKADDLINYFDITWEGAVPSTYVYDKDWNRTANMVGSKDYGIFEKEILKDLN